MFAQCSSLIYGPKILPATDLGASDATECYRAMFFGCSSLLSTPELPATILSDGCYYQMFSNCNNLVNAAELPAETIVNNCYFQMFRYCASLTTSPDIKMVNGGSSSSCTKMFMDCTSLNRVICSKFNPNGSSTTE